MTKSPPNFSGLFISKTLNFSKIRYLEYSKIGFSSTTFEGQYALPIFLLISSSESFIKIAVSGFDFDIFRSITLSMSFVFGGSPNPISI